MTQGNQPRRSGPPIFSAGDDIAYAMGKGMRYGNVVRVIGAGDQAAVEIQFEDGGKEIHRVKDRALSLLRRATGQSERDEELGDRQKARDFGIKEVMKSDIRRGSHR
ncbi:MAG: hypothetical protein IPF53_20090 [Blastocatellia bacterium]|nr:hypothetical protein [Blastocatellia bacterium]MBK6427650.1 hypothetical protein [Blastocatellia bacterium]